MAAPTKRIIVDDYGRGGKDMEPRNVIKFNHKKLASWTNNFSDSNYIGRFQFGKLYRGVFSYPPWITNFLVKTWEVPEMDSYEPGDNEIRLMKEIILLRHEMLIKHPGLVKLHGYCREGEFLAAVYEFKPFDSVFNLIPKDGFSWLQRIKVAVRLASLLKFLHAGKSSSYEPFTVQNLDAAHIVLDEDYNPKLCDFGLISGGIFPDGETYTGHNAMGCYGYTDIGASSRDHCSNKQDVFAFGVILLSLISKSVYTEEDRKAGVPFIHQWASKEYEAFESEDMNNTKFSLVHRSLEAESYFCPSDGHKITMLALQCVNGVEQVRPNMKQVFRSLLKLEVAKQHADFLEANKMRENGG